ncbi:MAG TPA: arginine--tRNA ligase [Candidatus Binataceae bacterium]
MDDAIRRANREGLLKSETAAFTIEAPKDSAHGDAACNAALVLARFEGKPPRAIAQVIVERIERGAEFADIAIAGAGFINFKMAPEYWIGELREMAGSEGAFWRPRVGARRRVQVEFLSANPTGPLTVGHGRNAVLGDALSRLLETVGYEVTREYYFNDGGRQMKLLGESVRARYLQEMGREASLPEDGYQGEYIKDIAAGLIREHGDGLVAAVDSEVFRAEAQRTIFADILGTCKRLAIRFDVFTNENDLLKGGQVDAAIEALTARGLTVEREGALWLSSEKVGLPNQQNVVLRRSSGEPTYRTPDIAYHIAKLKRGFDQIIDVFGADHIAEHEGVIAAVKALGYDTSPIRAIIYQFVTLTRGGEKIKMSTRRATYVALDELIDEVGADAVRFFFLFRKSDSQLDFDVDLAKRQAPENPVFYVQYAHARLASVLREAAKAGFGQPLDPASVKLDLLASEELDLVKRMAAYPGLMCDAALALEPHRIAFFLLELAGEFHRYYNKPSNRIISEDRELSAARLLWAKVLKDCIASGLKVVGVEAPERM